VPDPLIIVDTGPLVGFLVGDDHHHAWAAERFRELPAPFLTCEPVLTETFHLVRRLGDGPARFFELLESGVLAVDLDLLGERARLRKLILKYADLPMSLADACLVRMAEIHPEALVLTVDGHFRIYRKNGRQPVPAVLPDRA
jgi:uncharacterized protein